MTMANCKDCHEHCAFKISHLHDTVTCSHCGKIVYLNEIHAFAVYKVLYCLFFGLVLFLYFVFLGNDKIFVVVFLILFYFIYLPFDNKIIMNVIYKRYYKKDK